MAADAALTSSRNIVGIGEPSEFLTDTERAVTALAPLRIDLTGGFTDIPPFSSVIDSLHINLAFRLNVRVACRTCVRPDITVNFSEPLTARSEAPTEGRRRFLSAISAAVREFAIDHGLELSIHSNAPPGSGLGSSGAILVAAICGAAALAGVRLTRGRLAEKAINAAKGASIIGGRQDEYAAAFGSCRAYVFSRNAGPHIVNLASAELSEVIEKHLFVAQLSTRGRRADIVTEVVQAVHRGRPDTLSALHRLQQLAQELFEIMSSRRIDELPRLMREIRLTQQLLHGGICCPTTHATMEALRRYIPGVEYKLLGGGGSGGGVLVYAPTPRGLAISYLQKLGVRTLRIRMSSSGVATTTAQIVPTISNSSRGLLP